MGVGLPSLQVKRPGSGGAAGPASGVRRKQGNSFKRSGSPKEPLLLAYARGKAARALPSRLRSALFHNALRNSASPNSEMRRWRRIGKGFPLDSHYLKGFFKGGKGVGSSLSEFPLPATQRD